MVFDLVDKEGTKSGKGLGWSWFGLNDGKRDAKILRELGELYKKGAIDVNVFDQKIKGLTASSRENARAIRDNNVEGADLSKGFLDAAASADKMTISSKLLAGGMTALKIASNMIAGLVAGAVLNFAITSIDNWIHRIEKQKEKVENATSAFKSATSELESINTELATTKARIAELNAQESLTFVEEGELQKLKDATAELLIQQDIKAREEKKAHKQLAKEQADLYGKQYGNQQFSSDSVQEYATGTSSSMSLSMSDDINQQIAGYLKLQETIRETEVEYNSLSDEENKDSVGDTLTHLNSEADYLKDNIFKNVAELQKMVEVLEDPVLTDEDKINIFDEDWQQQLKNVQNGIYLIYDYLDKEKGNEIKFSKIINKEDFADVKAELEDLAAQGKLTADTLLDPKYKDFMLEMDSLGISAEQTANQINSAFSQVTPPLAQFNVSTLTSGIDALKASSEAIAKAYAEMNSESGELSLDTAKELITLDKDYLALLDTKNGKITIGTDILEQQFEIEKKTKIASIEGEKAKLIASQAAIKSAIDSANAEILAMSAVYNMSDSIYRDAMAKLGKSKSDLAENEKSIVDVDKALNVLNTISLGDFASGQKSAKSATDALTASLNKQKKALDEQKAALDKQKAKQDSALRAVNKLLDDEIKKLEEQKTLLADPEVAGSYGQRIKAIQDEMDALNDANDAREQAINLEKAQAEAERANSQKVHRIYREGIGFVWNTDQDAIAEANDKLEKIKLDKQLADLEAAKKKLQDTLAAEQKALDDNIKKLQGYKEKWGEVANAYQDAQDRIAAAQQIGADWESKVLNGRLDALEGFKTKYLAIQDELARKAEEIEAINKRIADAQNNNNGSGNGGSGSGNGSNGNGNGNNGATGGKLTYEDWLTNNPEPKAPPRGSGSYQWYLDSPEYKQYKASLYAWENSKHFAGFKNGTMCSPEGYANLHEEGSELVIPPPVNGHIEYLKYGTKVLPFDLSQKLMDMALNNPIMPDMRSLTMPDLQLSPIINNRGQEIHDIDMNITMNGVNDCEEMAKIISRNFKGILKQSFNKS